MHAVQTEAAPPNHGRIDLAIIGSTPKSSPAPRNTVAPDKSQSKLDARLPGDSGLTSISGISLNQSRSAEKSLHSTELSPMCGPLSTSVLNILMPARTLARASYLTSATLCTIKELSALSVMVMLALPPSDKASTTIWPVMFVALPGFPCRRSVW